MTKLPDPTKPSTRIKPKMTARAALEIDDPTKISTSGISRDAKNEAQRKLEEKEKA